MADLVLKDRDGTAITYNGVEVVSIPNTEGELEHFLNLETGGIPSGGTDGQVLKKKTNTDYDVGWENEVDITGKADKVTGGTADNFASLDANGNLKDSGKKATDFEPKDATILKKAQVVNDLVTGGIDVPLSAEQGKLLREYIDMNNVSSWKDIRNAVRIGLAPTLFPVGYEFKTAKTNFGDIVWRVVAHNHHKAKNPYLTKTMTIEKKFVFGTTSAYKAIQFDAPKALYFAEAGLVAGTYNFTLLAGYDVAYGGGKAFEFTLTQDVPIGGQLTFPWAYNSQASTTKVYSWASSTDTIGIENVPVVEGNGGTALGEANGTGNMNHTHRIRYGSNNYAQSAIRQLFNSDAALGSVWTPQTKFDRPPTWHTSADPAYCGFMNGLDPEFLEVVQPAVIPCRTNSIYECNSLDGTEFAINQTYNLTDKFFLLSRPEMYGTWDSASYKDGELLEFYDGLTDTERIKYDTFSVPRIAWLRSPYPGIALLERGVYTDGSLGNYNASSGYGASAACIIA